MSGVTFGVGLPLAAPVPELVALAQEVEALGYDFLWANDERLERDVYTVLALMAQHTRRLRLGPGVTNPYSRHPVLTAVAMATLAEIAPGRAVLGLGAGGTNHAPLGVRREAPVTALREAVLVIRTLLRGGEANLSGRIVQARRARLDFPPPRMEVPIYLGARGPRILELAGEMADGVIVGNLASVEGWGYALERVAAGARRAGRPLQKLELVAWLYTCIADEPAVALDAIRPMVATSLITSRPILDRLGLEMPPAFAAVMEPLGWNLAQAAVSRAAAAVPDEVALRFGLAGTPAQCRARLGELLQAFPQISQVTIVPFGPGGQSRTTVIRRFIQEVAHEVTEGRRRPKG